MIPDNSILSSGVADSSGVSNASIQWQEMDNTYRPAPLPLRDFCCKVKLDHPVSEVLAQQRGLPHVFMRRDCMEKMRSHARQDLVREQAGILCGHAYADDNGEFYIDINSVVAAPAFSDSAHFKFRKDSWQAIWNGLDGGVNVLGWYHTHPGMGVFLSQTDLRTQQLYFASPWQVAMVLDPVARQMALFCGNRGMPLPRWFVYDPR
jgi:proteasome lid subunit RPN8/RPN11